MKFLKPKFILLYLIVITLTIMVLAFVFGGLKATESGYQSRDWSKEGFISTQSIAEERNLNIERVIAKNENYFMVYNEATTVVTVYEIIPGTCDAPEIDTTGTAVNDFSNCTKYYATAVANKTNPTKDDIDAKASVFEINYNVISSNALSSTSMKSMANSAFVYDSNIDSPVERLTSIKLVNGGIQVLYDVKKTINSTDAVPKVIEQTAWDYLIRGTVLFSPYSQTYGNYEEKVENGVSGAKVSYECAAEMISSGFGTVAGLYEYGRTFVNDPERAMDNIDMEYLMPELLRNSYFIKDIDEDFKLNYLNTELSVCNTNQYPNTTASVSDDCKAYMIENELALEENFYANSTNDNFVVNFSKDFTVGKHINVVGSPCTTNTYNVVTTFNSCYTNISETHQVAPGKIIFYSGQTLDNDMSKVQAGIYKNVYNLLCRNRLAWKGGYNIADNLKVYGVDEYGNTLLDPYGNEATVGGIQQFISLRTTETVTENGEEIEVEKTVYSFVYEASDGRYVAQDLDGTWKYVTATEDLEYTLTDDEYTGSDTLKPLKRLFNRTLANEFNSVYDIEFSETSGRYELCIEYILNEDGLSATVLANSIKENDSDGQIIDVNLFPYFTYCDDSENSEGMMVIPDGSGAVINFTNKNNPMKANTDDYVKPYYGLDTTYPLTSKPEDINSLMMGMYGYIDNTEKKAVLGIVEEGSALTKLKIGVYRGAGALGNRMFFNLQFRESEEITSSGQKFKKYTSSLAQNDFATRFVFVKSNKIDGTFDYNDIAAAYREYLIEKYNLVEKDKTTTNATFMNVLGVYEKYELFAGIKYNSLNSLTTYEELINILNELNPDKDNKNFEDINIIYKSWTTDAMENSFTSNIKVSKKLGSNSELEDLQAYLSQNGYELYPELYVQTATEYDYYFGKVKYTAKCVGKTYAEQYQFNLATNQVDKKLVTTISMSPKYLTSYIDDFIDSYTRYNFTTAYVADLGNRRLADYSVSYDEIYNEEGRQYQLKALQNLTENLQDGLVLSAPFDYAFSYLKGAINVPFEATSLQMFDASIPLYQLVASGLFDYAGPSVNNSLSKSTNWFLLKSIETGSNLQFTISATDPKVLLDTNYTNYYDTYWVNNKENIIALNNSLNETGIMNGRLVKHEVIYDGSVIIKDVSIVTYEVNNSLLKIVVNLSSKDYNYNGTIVKSETYKVVS